MEYRVPAVSGTGERVAELLGGAIFSSRQPATFLVRARGSAWPERFVAQAPAGAFLAPGLRGGQAARVTVWNTECQPFLGRARVAELLGGAIFSSRQPATFPARATELLRQRHLRLQTTDHHPGECTGVCPAQEDCTSGPGRSPLGSGTPQRAGCTGYGVEYRGQPFLRQARAIELPRRRHLQIQTTGHLTGECTGVRPV